MDYVTVKREAAKLARKIGDEEWQKGETKYSLEAYEASDITPSEIFEKAQKLFEVERLGLELKDVLKRADASHTHPVGVTENCCHQHQRMRDIRQSYYRQAREILGWDTVSTSLEAGSWHYRAAAVAFLKIIKRMA